MFEQEIFEQKKILRSEMISRRRELSKAKRDKFSHEVVEKILAHSIYKNSKNVMAYASMAEEIQLQELFQAAFNSQKNLAIPFIIGQGNMQATLISNFDEMEAGNFGILTVRAENRKIISPTEIDCVIVPGAAFDIHGERLGLGGGYYDRFLKLATNAKKIALAFDFQIVENLPITENDVRVDLIITPTKIIDLLG